MLLYLNLVLNSKAPAWLRWALSLNESDAADLIGLALMQFEIRKFRLVPMGA